MRKIILLAASLAVGGISTTASATQVTSIKITSGLPDYLQVSEVIATQAGTGTDVALATAGATATSTSNYTGTTPDAAIDGVGPSSYPDIYHSGGSDGTDYLLISLAHAFDLSSLTIDGRTDSVQSPRDYYTYQLFDGMTLVGSGNIDARSAAHSGTATLAATGAVPEPASWAMMLAGFGAIGGAMRSRRKVAVSFG